MSGKLSVIRVNMLLFVSIQKVLQPAKKGGKRSGRGRRAILETTQFFNNRYPKSNATRMMDCG